MKDFASIYKEFRPKIHRYLSNLTSEDEATDLTQVVFLKVSRSLDNFRGESSLSTWIYRIATNTAHDHTASSMMKQRKAEHGCDEETSIDDFTDTTGVVIDQEYIRREMSACIRGVVEQLPESYREVLLLSDFEELANSEICEVLGLNMEMVKIRFHRGRAALRVP